TVTRTMNATRSNRLLALALAFVASLVAGCTAREPPPDPGASPAGAASPTAQRPAAGAPTAADVDPLPSWNSGAAKDAIVAFVARVTREDGPDFVPPSERIAAFDNDGTLWSEKPIYVQLAFALDRVRALAPKHPEWRSKEPFKS